MYVRIVLLLTVFLSFSLPLSFGEELGITVNLDNDDGIYQTGDDLVIYGVVDERKMPVVAVSIFDPDEMILSANNVEVSEDGNFNKTISLYSPFYDSAGTYTIQLDYGKISQEITFDVVNESELPIEQDYDDGAILPEVVFLITDKTSYTDNDTITITGIVSYFESPSVLVGIYDPFGMPAGFYFGEVDSNLEFTVNLLVREGVNFKSEGTYSVQAHYGETTATTYFDFTNAPKPENTTDNPDSKDNNKYVDKESQNDNAKSPENSTTPDSDNSKPESTIKNNPVAKKLETPTKNTDDNVDRSPVKDYDNLTVEDVELGMMLNEMLLACDTGRYADLISYYNGMGPALIRLCKYSESIHYFDQSIKGNPHDVEALTNKGVALSKLGRYNEAISAFDQALKINPKHVLALNNKANVFAAIGNHQDAISTYKTAVKIDPQNKILQTNLATIQYIENHDPQSEVDFSNSQPPSSLIKEPEPPPPPPIKEAEHTRHIPSKNNNDNSTTANSVDKFTEFLHELGKKVLGILAKPP